MNRNLAALARMRLPPAQEAPARVDIPNLHSQLRQLAAALENIGAVDQLQKTLQIVLPVERALWFGFAPQQTSSPVPAGASGWTDIWTCPQDLRFEFSTMVTERDSGDNTFTGVRFRYPAGYGTGVRAVYVDYIFPATSTRVTTLYSPVPVEPGTIMQINLAGVGASASAFNAYPAGWGSKVVRANTP